MSMKAGAVLLAIDIVGFAKWTTSISDSFKNGQLSHIAYDNNMRVALLVCGVIAIIGVALFLWGIVTRTSDNED